MKVEAFSTLEGKKLADVYDMAESHLNVTAFNFAI